MKQTRLFSLGLVLAAALLHGGGAMADESTKIVDQVAEATENQPVVVELFTSQGCSSCPPADAYLGDLAGRDDVLALSFHVDYWDYIGWPDPFAEEAHGSRQRIYAKHFDLRYVYTPQMVVQGAFQVTGSDRSSVAHAIDQARELTKLPVHLEQTHAGQMTVAIGGTGTHERSNLWAIAFDRSHQTEIRRGENRGRSLTYKHVVRDLVDLGEWSGTEQRLTLSQAEINWKDRYGLAVVLQSEATGRILGSAVYRSDNRQSAKRP